MNKLLARYKTLFSQRSFYWSLILGVLLLLFSLYVNYAANNYVASSNSTSVHDLLLDHLPVLNVDDIFWEGAIYFWLFIIFLILYQPKRIPFVFKSIALFIIIRSIFISLTHLGPPFNAVVVSSGSITDKLTSGDDLFFSAHTGFPFLMMLLFWDDFVLRVAFFVASLIFGAAVLLGHLHYSIDVFAAFFITYGIYQLAERWFPADRKLFLSEG